MRVSIYKVWYFTVTEVEGKEVRRTSPTYCLVAAKDQTEAAKLLPLKPVEKSEESNRNVVQSCQSIQQNVIAAESGERGQ